MLEERGNDAAREAAAIAIEFSDLIPGMISMTDSDITKVRYGAAKALTIVSEKSPELLYRHVDGILNLLKTDKTIIKWNAIMQLGNMAKVDEDNKIGKEMIVYLSSLLDDDSMVTAGHAIENLAKIAEAKRDHCDDIVGRLLGIQNITRNEECLNIHLGKVFQSFENLYEAAGGNLKKKMKELAERNIENPRNSTAKKAQRFLKNTETGRII